MARERASETPNAPTKKSATEERKKIAEQKVNYGESGEEEQRESGSSLAVGPDQGISIPHMTQVAPM